MTGSSGFIAQHIVKLLAEKGYKVVGTVRSEAKGEKLKSNVGSDNFEYEIVPDIQTKHAFDDALKKHPEVTVVIHAASPFTYDISDAEKDLVVPAMEGTRNIFEAISKYAPQVTRVVVTSSDAAIYSFEGERDPKNSFDESSWNHVTYEEACKDAVTGYYGSKTFAEKIAWEMSKAPDVKYSLTTVNPVYVFGPQAFGNEVLETLNVSNELINTILKKSPSEKFDNDDGGYIDVRDVAKAHVAAFELETTKNKRLFMTNGNFSMQAVVDIINDEFPKLKGNIPIGSPGTSPQDIANFSSNSNKATREILGFDFIPLKKIVVDVVQQVLDSGKSNY